MLTRGTHIFHPAGTAPCLVLTCGANRAKALKEPEKSIPHGTLAAITISLIMYTSYMILWGAVADREYLKHGPGHGYAYGTR
jgi:amino acid transporter